TGCRKASSRSARTRAKVTPAPIVMRELASSICVRARAVARTTVETDRSPSLSARITSVPPPRYRASRSDERAAAASPEVANVFTVTGMISSPLSSGPLQMLADRLEARLIDLLTDHFGDLGRFGGARREARLPMPECAVAIRHRQQP